MVRVTGEVVNLGSRCAYPPNPRDRRPNFRGRV